MLTLVFWLPDDAVNENGKHGETIKVRKILNQIFQAL